MIASFSGAVTEMACQNIFSGVLRGDGLLPVASAKPVWLACLRTSMANRHVNLGHMLRVSPAHRNVEKRNYRR